MKGSQYNSFITEHINLDGEMMVPLPEKEKTMEKTK